LTYTSEDKLQREVEKLTEEVRVLKKPYLQPTFWIGVIALGVSVAGNIGQFLTYESRATIAEAKVAQAKLDRIEMENKRDEARIEFAELQSQLASVQETIGRAKQESNSTQVKEKLIEADRKLTNLQTTTQATQQSLDTSESAATQQFRNLRQNTQNLATVGKLQLAKDKEREGFQSLIDGDYDNASAAFQAAESSYNGYHNVYELARILRENKSQMSDPAKKKEIFQRIVRDHSYGAPPDLWERVKTIAK
jgi:hypothetical protein